MRPSDRRIVFASLVFVTILGLMGLMGWSLSERGFKWYELLMFICFAITLPWTAIGFWNAVIGFGLMRFVKKPAEFVFPALASTDMKAPLRSSTAIALCIRNENVDDVERNATVMIARLVASGYADNFHFYVLSDTSDPEIAAKEARVFAALQADWADRMAVTYRLRTENWGFKAGNIREFCETYGANHDFLLTLDADSVMSASAILRLVRVMEQNHTLGIVQSLVVGLPSESAFTRVFQFGMRMGMKSFTLGSAWWQADCGPYWGHNALIRMKPFIEHCHLPVLSGKGALSGYILSHDQVEATFMRRAGYECRVIAEEGGSFEENPPHILEFIRRDLRWCHGNMQYLKLLREPGLLPTSRMQLVLAILMFISAPAWMGFVTIGTLTMMFYEMAFEGFNLGPGLVLFAIIMTMIFAPKLVSVADVLLRRDLRRSFGGGGKVMIGVFIEIVFSMLLAPIMAVCETLFLAKLPFGKAKGWAAQARSANCLPLFPTVRCLAVPTLFGACGVFGIWFFTSVNLTGFFVSIPVFMGPLVAIPFALTSAHLSVGHLATRLGLWQIPEEETLPVAIRALDLVPISLRAHFVNDGARRKPLTTDELLVLEAEIDDRLVA